LVMKRALHERAGGGGGAHSAATSTLSDFFSAFLSSFCDLSASAKSFASESPWCRGSRVPLEVMRSLASLTWSAFACALARSLLWSLNACLKSAESLSRCPVGLPPRDISFSSRTSCCAFSSAALSFATSEFWLASADLNSLCISDSFELLSSSRRSSGWICTSAWHENGGMARYLVLWP